MADQIARVALLLSVVLAGCTADSSGLGSETTLADTSVVADTTTDTAIDTEPFDTTTSDTGVDTTPEPDTAPEADTAPEDADAGCIAPNTTCGTACVDTQSSYENCGGCAKTCATALKYSIACVSGACACRSAEKACGTTCTVTTEDVKNCGTCGTACKKDEWCRADTCECRPGLTKCAGSCVDTQGDLLNCGACGNACSNNERCVAGSCVSNMTDCPMGRTVCTADKGRGSCFDLQTDATHCGACGTTCPADQLCIAGTCRKYAPAAGCLTCGGCGSCTGILGPAARCCPALVGHSMPTCVDGPACP